MIDFAIVGTGSIERNYGVKINPSGASVFDIMPAVVFSRGAEWVSRPLLASLGVVRVFDTFISNLFRSSYFCSIYRVGLILIFAPCVLNARIFSAIQMFSGLAVNRRTQLAKSADARELAIKVGSRLFNLAHRASFEFQRFWAFFHCDIIATKGEFKQREFGENPERATPSRAAYVSRKAEGCGRCNDQTPSESGNESTSALPRMRVKTWPELHGNMQMHRIKSRCDNTLTTIESRSGTVADNITKNNAWLSRAKERGRVKPFSGGSTILQELSFQSNGTAMYYSG